MERVAGGGARTAGVLSAVILCLGGAAIHVVAISRAQSADLGLALAGLGVALAVAAALVAVKPSPRNAVAAALVCFAVVAFWAISRFGELLGGPVLWLAEDRLVASIDVVPAASAVLAGLIFLRIGARGARRRRRRPVWSALGALPTLLVGGLLACGSVAAVAGSDLPPQAGQPSRAPVGAMTTFTYAKPGGARLAMDVYEPAATARRPAPAVLYLHGGAWLFGDRRPDSYFRVVERDLVARGFVVASIDYRMGSLFQFPAEMEDAESAVRFLRANSGLLGIDPRRIVAWGGSSGGSSAALLGMRGTPAGWSAGPFPAESSDVRAVVDFSGLVDYALQSDNPYASSGPLGRQSSRLASAVIKLALFGTSPDASSQASAVSYVGPDSAPVYIVHGTRDFVVPPAESVEFARRLEAAGVPVRLVLIPGASHVGVDPALERQVPAAVDFVVRETAS
jgi:acetyl esterase/lipase